MDFAPASLFMLPISMREIICTLKNCSRLFWFKYLVLQKVFSWSHQIKEQEIKCNTFFNRWNTLIERVGWTIVPRCKHRLGSLLCTLNVENTIGYNTEVGHRYAVIRTDIPLNWPNGLIMFSRPDNISAECKNIAHSMQTAAKSELGYQIPPPRNPWSCCYRRNTT